MSTVHRIADATQHHARQSAGWLAFLAARQAVRASARLLGREVPLAHVLRDLDVSLARLDRATARPVAGGDPS